jgi:transcriptional regulator with XRE-family HTH domain
MAGRNVFGRSGFGALLRRHRAAANLSQEDLAERSGLSVQAIGAIFESQDGGRPR